MSKKSKGQRRRDKRKRSLPIAHQPLPKEHWWQLGKLWAGFLGFLALLGGAAAIAEFVPHISLEVSQPSNRSDPFSIVVTIHNAGIIALRDIRPAMGICLSSSTNEPPPKQTVCSGPLNPPLMSPRWHRNTLAVDESYSFALNDIYSSPFASYEEVSIKVDYRPWFFPINESREFKLVTRRRGDGALEWMHEPLE